MVYKVGDELLVANVKSPFKLLFSCKFKEMINNQTEMMTFPKDVYVDIDKCENVRSVYDAFTHRSVLIFCEYHFFVYTPERYMVAHDEFLNKTYQEMIKL